MIDEGLLRPDRHSKKIYGDDIESLQKKIEGYLERDKQYSPKASNVKKDSVGRFYVEYSYNTNDDAHKETVFSKVARGLNKAKEVVKKVSDSIPRQGTLTAATGFLLGQEQARFVKAHPDVVFSRKVKNQDGSWSITYSALKNSLEKSTSQDRINNIQRALSKLSDDKLKKIEDFIK